MRTHGLLVGLMLGPVKLGLYAVAIAFMAFLETVAVGRSTRSALDPPISNNRELMANGTAAVAGAFFTTAPPAGGFSQTMVNLDAGGRTQLSQLITSALAVVVALFFAPLLSDLPQASLAAIVVVAVLPLTSLNELRRIARIDRVELLVALLAGAIGLPVFAEGRGEITSPGGGLTPTIGYLVGFILAAAMVGRLAERGWDRHPASTAGLMALGNLVIYLIGVPLLAILVGLPLGTAIWEGAIVFIPWDAAKIVLAAILLPLAWRIVGDR
jgi:hypothetical protein